MTAVNTFLEKLREYILIRSFIRLPKLNIFFIKKEKIARFLICECRGRRGIIVEVKEGEADERHKKLREMKGIM